MIFFKKQFQRDQIIFTTIIGLVIVLSSCSLRKNYFRSYNDIYSASESDKIIFTNSIIHQDNQNSWLYYSIESIQLRYKKTDFDSLYTATFKLSYQLPEASGHKKSGDTLYFILSDHIKKITKHKIEGKVKIKITQGFKGFLDISLLDLNSGRRGFIAVYVNKEDILSGQNFFLSKNRFNENPDYKIIPGDSIFFYNNRLRQLKKIQIHEFNLPDEPAPPPFSSIEPSFEIKPKKTFNLFNSSGNFKQRINAKGFYFFKSDSSINKGLCVSVMDENFPLIVSDSEKINCMRYILSNDEFKMAKSSEQNKNTIIELWKIFTGSEKRAINLMSEWYKRASIANDFFTAVKEGWKTDRGMIFLVFGHPRKVEKTNEKETWFYGDNNALHSFYFEFDKIQSPYSENEYLLIRSTSLKNRWYEAVDTWRKGRIYSGY